MRELEDLEAKLPALLAPLPDEAAPCGADLEYDNEFLALTQAAAGKPESQFGSAEPPDWRKVVETAESLFDRTRDLRVAIEWMRGQLHLRGYGSLVVGLKLINGYFEQHWEHLHPLPDPDDGDLYGRVNALTLLRENAGALGDIRDAKLIEDRAIGQLLVRDVETALGLAPLTPGRVEVSQDQARRMLEAALAKDAKLRVVCKDAVAQVRQLIAQANERMGNDDAPDLRPLYALANGIVGLLPEEAMASAADDAADDGSDSGPGAAARTGGSRGLPGSLGSREEAIRAIDLVIAYLEQAEPSNVAALFLRRARHLISHNFLQLMKELAPDSLAEVARIVGVDPETVEDPRAST